MSVHPSQRQGSQHPPGRFFPPPFRIDRTAFDYAQEGASSSHVSSSPAPRALSLTHSLSSSSFGSSAHPRSSVPPSTSTTRGASGNKRRKLQFSSELGPPRNRFNADGSENVDWARYQSALALKRKWEAIYDKFKDAHLAPQDEIFLGGRGKGDLRVCRDRGVLRALQDEVQFGHFIEEDEYKQQQEQQQLEEGEEGYDLANSDEDELGGWGNKSYLKSQYPEFNSENNDWDAGTARQGGRRGQEGVEEEEEEEEEEAPPDPELLEFLEAERQRREIMGPESVASEAEADGSDDDDDDDVVDFSDPLWDLPRHRREQARRRQQRLQRMRSTRWRSEESSSDDGSSVIEVDAYDEAQGEEDSYSAEEDVEQQQEEEGFAYNSLDEMDLFNDDPDLSAYDPTAIEDLIRRENATLAAQGKMLVPEEQVADLAMALTRGGPGMADEYHALSSQPPSSSDTLVNPAYSVLAPGKEASECLDAAWNRTKGGAEEAYTRGCRRSTSPLFLGMSSPSKGYGDGHQLPTPPRSVMSDASSDATKVGSEADMPISSPAPGRFYSRHEQRSQSRASFPPTHAHRQESEEEHGYYRHAEQHAMEASSAIGLDTPMRQQQQLNHHQVQLEEEEEEEAYAYEAQQEQEEEEEAQEPAPLPWLPSFVGVQVRKPKRRGRAPGSKNKPRPTLEQLEMDIEVIDDDDDEEVESAEEAEPKWEREPTPEPKWRARKRIIRDDSDEDEVEPDRAPVAAVASSEEEGQLEDAWRAPKKQRRSKDGSTSSATNAQQSVTPACGGPSTCTKTFCMSCGAARSSALLL